MNSKVHFLRASERHVHSDRRIILLGLRHCRFLLLLQKRGPDEHSLSMLTFSSFTLRVGIHDLNFLLEVSERLQLRGHIIDVVVEFPLLSLYTIVQLLYTYHFTLYPLVRLLDVVEGRQDLERIQSQQVVVGIESDDSFHRLISYKLNGHAAAFLLRQVVELRVVQDRLGSWRDG